MIIELSHREELAHGVSILWYFERRAPIVTMQSYSREAVDVAVATITQLALTWNIETPYAIGLELLDSKMITPYSRARFAETATLNTHVSGRYVLVVPRDFIGQAVSLYFTLEYKTRTHSTVEGRAFHQREDALAWLAPLFD